jgi:hypothetical protein
MKKLKTFEIFCFVFVMTSLHKSVMGRLQSVIDLYFSEVKICERDLVSSNVFATKIQAKYRMYRFYKHYQRNRQAAITI